MSGLVAGIVSLVFLTTAAVADIGDEWPDFGETKLLSYPPSNAYIPLGFDSNDTPQVVISGEYPSTCYQTGYHSVKVDEQAKKVLIRNWAYLNDGCFCVQTPVPFTKTIDLPKIVNPGSYDILFEKKKEGASEEFMLFGHMPIVQATVPSKDDHIYAPVDEAFFDQQENPQHIVIRGKLRDSCLKFESLELKKASEDVYHLLPVLKHDETDGCSSQSKTFEKKIKIDEKLTQPTLFHIRAMDGRAVNKLFM